MPEPRWRQYLRFWKRNVAADVDDELRFHVAERVAEYESAGLTHEAALAAARAQFGDAHTVRAELVAIDARVAQRRDTAAWFDALRLDLVTSIRSLRRQPAFSIAVIVTLALGLGVNAAMFSFLDRVFVRMPSGIANPAELRRLWAIESDNKGQIDVSTLSVGVEAYAALKTALNPDASVALYAMQGAVRFGDDDEANKFIVRAAADYFPLLGVRAARGRLFTEEEATISGPPAPAVVISDAMWRNRFGGDSAIIGKSLDLNNDRLTIIGVTPPGFRGTDLNAIDAWVPLGETDRDRMRVLGSPRSLGVLLRRRSAVSDEALGARATLAVQRVRVGERHTDSLRQILTGSIIQARGPGKEQIGIAQTYLANIVGLRVMQDLRNSLYSHLQFMPLRFFTTTRTGEIQSRLANDVGGVQSVVTDTASNVLANVVTIISTIAAMLLISVQLTLLSLALMPLFLWLTVKVGRARREVATSTQRTMADMSSITEETLSVSGILLSKSFGRQRHEIGRFSEENERLTGLQIRQTMIGRSFFAVVGTFFSITPALVYLVAGWVMSKNPAAINSGDIVGFTTLQARLFFPIGSMLQVSTEVQSSFALFDRIFEYLDMDHEIEDKPDAVTPDLTTIRGKVVLDHVRFRYEAPPETGEPPSSPTDLALANEAPRAWTLDDVSLEIPPGQLAALVGPSGAGKTTITYLVPRLYDVQEGRVLIDDLDVREYALESLGEMIGVVTQETYLFHTTIRRNLMYGRPGASQEEMEAAARAANIHDRIVELPHGYDTVVGERGYKLSGGEKQRLAIARVVLKDPRILILDEATSSLDTTSERLVQSALEPLMEGRTTVAIAHRLSTILKADVIFVIDRGRVAERGTHAELLASGGLYAQLYQQQFKGGLVEAELRDGVLLRTGEIVPPASSAG